MNKEEIWIARLKGFEDAAKAKNGGYLRIRTKNGQYVHGGNQNWWKEEQRAESFLKACRRDSFRLSHMGCGVIAMNDLEVYLQQQGGKEQAESTPSGIDLRSNRQDADLRGNDLSQELYEEKVELTFRDTFRIHGDPINLLVGLYPWKMERGLKKFLLQNGNGRTGVKWAPYYRTNQKRQKQMVLDSIVDMLKADYPVVCSYHSFEKKNVLFLYRNLADAKADSQKANDIRIGSHYMTIIGVLKDQDDTVFLQIESWGRIFYTTFERYARHLNYFTNILRIYED